jgi:hypothetical protein
MAFADLKKQSKLGSLTAKLVKEVEKMNTSSGSNDERLWKLDVDKSGNGYAVIRFLPSPEGEDLPFVKVYSHAFQGSGGWLIDNCLTTINQKCPVCEHNSGLWNNGTDAGKEVARKQKRKLTYVSNIYVVKIPQTPKTKVKSSCSSMVKRSLINSLKRCNPSLKMRLQLIRLTSGKVPISN